MEIRARVLFRLKAHIFPWYYVTIGLLSLTPYLLPAVAVMAMNADHFDASDEMLDVTVNTYLPDGSGRYYTESSKLSYLHEDELLVFDQFRMRYYSNGVETMSLQSASATVKDTVIELGGVVELQRPEGDGRTHEVITTRNVDIKTDTWIAVTSEAATLERGTLTLMGRGMIADLKQGTIDLLEDVRTSHEI